MVTKNNPCIVIPVYKSNLTKNEIISFKQCLRVLSNYAIYLVTHENLDISEYIQIVEEETVSDFNFKYFSKEYFQDIKGYNKLMMSREFYFEFSTHNYLLVYQLDCFVFRDELLHWCKKGYDYVGAPWLEGFNNATIDSSYLGVGNGGLSLRKTSSFLQVLETKKQVIHLDDLFFFRKLYKSKVKVFFKFFQSIFFGNNFYFKRGGFSLNEDFFWGYFSPKSFDYFSVPSTGEALKFAFEVLPNKMFKDNNNEIPFGCHAWWRYDKQFWIPFIEKFNYKVN